MEIMDRQKIERFIPALKVLCVLAAFGAPSLLLLKDLYFYDWSEKKETIVYSIPMVFLFFFWIKFKLDEEHIFDVRIIGLDGLTIFLTALRLIGLLFHSGHVLFLLYSFMTTKNNTYRILCIPMILVTAYFKIFYWGDFITPIIGAIMALTLVYFRNRVMERIKTVANKK
ncbi:MAG: hypothetical protein ACI9J3_002086 [Parvicellaceae bacterium]|jgi:hypothetical protein